jgi:hypothetical protein
MISPFSQQPSAIPIAAITFANTTLCVDLRQLVCHGPEFCEIFNKCLLGVAKL